MRVYFFIILQCSDYKLVLMVFFFNLFFYFLIYKF